MYLLLGAVFSLFNKAGKLEDQAVYGGHGGPPDDGWVLYR
jgi:hypothetical protein